jgi:hypothetical protein
MPTPVSVAPTALSIAFPRFVAPVPGTIESTSTSPMSTPLFADSLPIALVPAGSGMFVASETRSTFTASTPVPAATPACPTTRLTLARSASSQSSRTLNEAAIAAVFGSIT